MSNTPRVLVVDDDEAIREMVSIFLTDEGYDVKSVAGGAAAFALLPDWEPALILLDMRMSGMDGPEFARRYRQRSGSHAPVILFTAASAGQVDELDNNYDAILAKPFELDELLSMVERLLHKHGTER